MSPDAMLFPFDAVSKLSAQSLTSFTYFAPIHKKQFSSTLVCCQFYSSVQFIDLLQIVCRIPKDFVDLETLIRSFFSWQLA